MYLAAGAASLLSFSKTLVPRTSSISFVLIAPGRIISGVSPLKSMIVDSTPTAVGPVTGGLISKYFGWRGVFFINVPFLIGLILLIPFCMNLKHEKKLKNVKIDFLGAILSIGMMLGLTLGLVQGRQWHWNSPAIISLFGISAICGVGFIVTEMKSAKPMIDLSLFKSRNFDGASLALAISSFFLGGFVILIPTFLVKFKGLTELQAAIRILHVGRANRVDLLSTGGQLVSQFTSPGVQLGNPVDQLWRVGI